MRTGRGGGGGVRPMMDKRRCDGNGRIEGKKDDWEGRRRGREGGAYLSVVGQLLLDINLDARVTGLH